MTQDVSRTLAATLLAHRQWLSEEAGGSRADLSRAILVDADLRRADLRGADLSGAFLTGADLSGAFLTGADLSGANLSGAFLNGAVLSGADLRGADLSDADLSGADLRGAFLTGADLSGAFLTGADLSGARIDTGETWETYLAEVVPQLLLAGEQMAFDVTNAEEAPALLRPRVRQFVMLYDAGLIPAPDAALLARQSLGTTPYTQITEGGR